MTTTTFAEFETTALADGYDQVIERRWAPDEMVDTHGHPFEAHALVSEGEMWLTQAGETRHLVPDDTFLLAANEPHAERYGSEGATYWVARRGA